MSDERKTRGDSEIDRQLSPAEQDAFFAYAEVHTLAEAKRWLYDHRLLSLSEQAISNWLAKERKVVREYRFSQLLAEIRIDTQEASEIAADVGASAHLNEANVILLGQALFQAKRSGDPYELKAAAKLFAMVMESVAKAKAAEASVIVAETSRDKFQFDAAKRALEEAAALQRINADTGSEREKVERAIETLFGRRPETNITSAGAGKDVGTASPVGTLTQS